MDVIRFGLGLRALRRRRRLTQSDLGQRVGMSHPVISRLERGEADRVTVRTIERVAAGLGARIEVRLLWAGEALDRLLDERHASIVEMVVELLARLDWETATEVSFNIRGERGAIDVFAFHPVTRTLLVGEVKSVVPDLQAMLVAMDRKARLARVIAHDRAWHATDVGRLLVLPNDRTARRRIDRHRVTLDVAFPARNAEVKRWLRSPSGALAGLLFLSDGRHPDTRHRIGASSGRSGPKARSRPPGDSAR